MQTGCRYLLLSRLVLFYFALPKSRRIKDSDLASSLIVVYYGLYYVGLLKLFWTHYCFVQLVLVHLLNLQE